MFQNVMDDEWIDDRANASAWLKALTAECVFVVSFMKLKLQGKNI